MAHDKCIKVVMIMAKIATRAISGKYLQQFIVIVN